MPRTKLSKRFFPRGQRVKIVSGEGYGEYGTVEGVTPVRGRHWVKMDEGKVLWPVYYWQMEKIQEGRNE